jgi:hypothetical protein
MFNKSLCTPALVLVGLLCSSTAMALTTVKSYSASRVTKSGRSAVTVIESVLAGTNIPVMSTFSGPVGATGGGLSLVPTQNDATTSALPSVPALPLTDGVATKDQLLQSAAINIEARANDVATSLKALMAAQGHKAGNFIFEQTIKPAGSPTYVKVLWHVAVLENGRVVYSSARIADPDPYYVYVIYTSKQVAAGLPGTWAYPDGGKFKWQLVKKDGTQLTGLTTIDVAGAFDMPTVPSGTSVDPDWGVKCLANVSSSNGCPVPIGFTDVKTLISNNSAAGAIIDYTRKLEPDYVENGDGSSHANLAISFDTRNLTHNNSCTNGTFRTTGRYGFTLKSTYDRFSYKVSLPAPALMSRSSSSSFSPTQTFDYSQSTSLTTSGLGNYAISPFDPTGGLIDASQIAGVQYLAPVSQDGNSGIYQESINYNGEYRVCSSSDPWIGNLYTNGRGGHAVYTVQQCGAHMWWGTDYSFGIDRSTGQGWTVWWYYGTQRLQTAVNESPRISRRPVGLS